MRVYIKSSFACLVICLSSLLALGAGRALAAGNTATILTTSPVAVDLSATPGQSISTILQVQNNSSSTTTISVKLEKFRAYGIDGQAAFYNPPSSDPSLSWVQFSRTNFVAQPGVWMPVKMTINLPRTASLGYYYAVLLSANNGAHISKKTAVVKSANAIFVLVNTNSSNETRALKIKNFSATKKVYNFLPASFNLVINNSGNIFLAPEGDIYISRSPGGKTIDTLPINPNQNNILPNSSRQFTMTWSNGFPVYKDKRLNGQILSNKKGQPIKYLDWNFSSPLSNFRFGKYYANLALVYNNGTTEIPVNAVVSFWVIPWVPILEILIIIIILILLIMVSLKSIKKFSRKLLKTKVKL